MQKLALERGVALEIKHGVGREGQGDDDALVSIYQSSAAFVFGSHYEPIPLVISEAMACGLPVVVSDAGGLPEVVRDGETGLVVPRDDVPALQAALKRLVLDPALRERLGRNGRVHVEREYEWGHCVDLMEQAYARTIALGGRR